MISTIMGIVVLFIMLQISRKGYEVSMRKAVAIHVVFTVITIIGAKVGSYLGELTFAGLRLYGILMLDTIAMFFLYKPFKMELGQLSDYLAAPIIAVCAIVKVECLRVGCCYGMVLYLDEAGNAVRFPSQLVEFLVWVALTAWLLIINRKGQLKNMLWGVATIWFGIFRLLVDYLRGSPFEGAYMILGLTSARFWSIITALMGVMFLFISFRKHNERNPKIAEMLKAIFGLNPIGKNRIK